MRSGWTRRDLARRGGGALFLPAAARAAQTPFDVTALLEGHTRLLLMRSRPARRGGLAPAGEPGPRSAARPARGNARTRAARRLCRHHALGQTQSYAIARRDARLTGSRNGGTPETLSVEIADVFFVPGLPRVRKIS
jgi:hypothetical protein